MSFFFQAEDGTRDVAVTGVQTCALPILLMSKRKVLEISKQNFPYDLVVAYWEDIVGSCEWSDISDIKKAKTAVCCSFGWLVEQNEKTTVIMADFIFEDSGVIKQGGGHTVIPTKNIIKIKKLKI